MKNEIKKIWLEALRSGEYAQTTGDLKNLGGFCCLGVLCDLHRLDTECASSWERDRNTGRDAEFYLGQRAVLPLSVSVWAGLEQQDPRDSARRRLAAMNDGQDGEKAISFGGIADIIEKDF